MSDVWPPELERRRLEPLRRITVEHLESSWRSGVPITLVAGAEATALLEARKRIRRANPEVTITVIIAALLARVLVRHPAVNARLDGTELVSYRSVNLGIAIALEDGNLVVPVIRDAHSLTPPEFASRLKGLAALAERRALQLPDLRGALVTLSSVGMLVDDVVGTASIPPGQTALVLVSGITDQPVCRDGAVVARPVLPISLTIDHRVANGAEMCRFLDDLVTAIEHCNPESVGAGQESSDA